MPMSRARRLCPAGVIILQPDLALYAEVSAGRHGALRARSPRSSSRSASTRRSSTSPARCAGSAAPTVIAELIRARVHDEQGITCSVGVASTKFVAKLASTRAKPDGLLVVPADRVIDFLHPLPVGALWGVGEKTEEQLARLGLRTVADIAHTPLRHPAAAPSGQAAGTHLHELAWGRDPRVGQPARAGEEHRQRGDLRARRRRPRGDPPRAAAPLREGGRPAAPGRATSAAPSCSRCASPTSPRSPGRAPCAARPTSAGTSTTPCAPSTTRSGCSGRGSASSGCGSRGCSTPSSAPHQLLLDEPEAGWREAERAVDRAAARFGRGSVRPAALVRPVDPA